MSNLDWIILVLVLIFIVAYGMWKSRHNKNMEAYLRGGRTMPWYAVGISIMATQASAITFLSAPGQAYTDGMRFVQYYFGLPIAMIILCMTVVPVYHKLKVYTAYEYLESRFDQKTRALAAILFLVQRSLATGLTVYAPSIVLSCILGWNIYLTTLIIGSIVTIYTVTGGIKAVNYTQMGQMAVILGGMLLAAIMIAKSLPQDVSVYDAVRIAGKHQKMNIIDLSFDLNNRYNIWSGIIGGLFLALSYFGTDQSQVGRYLSGKSLTESRLGLLMNGLLKIPMQVSILFIGVMLFIFFQFHHRPLFFNPVEENKILASSHADIYRSIQSSNDSLSTQHAELTHALVKAIKTNDENAAATLTEELRTGEQKYKILRKKATDLFVRNDPLANTDDTNYIFFSYVTRYLPHGLIGLLIAVIFAASMSSTASALNGLASTSIIDIYRRSFKPHASEAHYLKASRWATAIWGAVTIIVAEFATRMGSLIEAVNVLGSLFYGTILGIFMVAFYLKNIKGGVVFYAAMIAEVVVLACYKFTTIAFLWYNLIGCLLVVLFSLTYHRVFSKR